tara:strand:+ start:3419 stop:3760 length:342 start_codon:yes stop_codon:yes gene_type:complete
MAQRYFMKITVGNIAEGYVVPKSDLIEVLENGTERKFSTSNDHIEVDTKETAVGCRYTKYNPVAEESTIKTSASFTHLTNANNRWNLDTGNEQELVLTENSEGVVTSSDWVDI